jgi:outer membrane receptor protein involved in Fe transport
MSKYILSIVLIFGFLTKISAEESEKPAKGIIEGKVLEKSSNVPIEYATLAVFSLADSSLVTGSISGPDGQFKITGIPQGEYYLRVDFIGYEDKMIEGLSVSKASREIDLGVIQLETTAIQLEGAEIIADKMAMEYKFDRKVINVSQDISSAGGSAVDVLEKVPSVRVDINGEVELRGSSSFTVLIDGKPSVLQGSEALQQLPASTIENIEIITNPSAKYDPDGTAGIINIVTKKKSLKGFSGMVDASIGTNQKYASDLYLNYKNNNINVFGSINWNDRQFPREEESIRETISNDTSFFRDAKGDAAWMRNGLTFKAGLDYYVSDRSTISFSGEYGDVGFGWDNFMNVHEYYNPERTERYYRDDNVFRWSRYYYSVNANYLQKFNQEGHQLRIFGFFSNRGGSQVQDKKEFDTDENFNPVGTDPFMLRSTEEGPSNRFRLEIDWTKPVLGNGKIEAGYQYRRFDETESYSLEYFDYDFNEWIEDEQYYKKALFERNIHAVYGTFSQELGNFQYQLGLRGEYTYRNITVENTGESSLVDRFDYFPSAHLTYRIKDKNQLMASYSRRIDRPRGWYLEPFVTYVNESTRRIGNPGLLPEYTDSYEVGYIRTLSAGNIAVDAYFRQTNNKITFIQYFDEETELVYNTFRNLNNDQALGTELSALYDITKWLNLNISGTYYYYRVEDLTGTTGDYRTSGNWDTRLITSFKLPTNTRIQVNFSYESASVTAQGRREATHFTDVTIRQEFLKNQLTATLKVGDIFASRVQESFIQGDNLYIYEREIPENRIITFTLSYRLNNFKPIQRSYNGGGAGM